VGVTLIILVEGRVFLVPLAIAVLLFSLTSAARDRISNLRIGRSRSPSGWRA
jgi:AI-2 transport protein TqsA